MKQHRVCKTCKGTGNHKGKQRKRCYGKGVRQMIGKLEASKIVQSILSVGFEEVERYLKDKYNEENVEIQTRRVYSSNLKPIDYLVFYVYQRSDLFESDLAEFNIQIGEHEGDTILMLWSLDAEDLVTLRGHINEFLVTRKWGDSDETQTV